MPATDNNPTAQPTVTPDGKKSSFAKRLIDPTESSSAAGAPPTRLREKLTAPDIKPSAFKRLSEAFKSTKSGIAPSTLTTRSVENLATPPSVSAAHLASNVPAPMVPEGGASAQVATTMVSVSSVNVHQESSTTPAPAGPTLVVDDNQQSSPVPDNVVSENNSGKYISLPSVYVSSFTIVINTVSLSDVNQTAQPDPNVSQAQSKFKGVSVDDLSTVLRLAKQASDWNAFLKAALGSVVAVIDLAKTVSSNSQDMKDTLDHIQGLLPILGTSAQRLEDCKYGFGEGSLMTFAISMQTELEKMQTIQSHNLFKHVLQGTEDVHTLLGVYKNISEALEQFKSDR
ncbi:hypothetical protein H0H87_000445 [Tephrocybe sp. NHM501043]|nr:hypothetical protein H0H87_000445 [Tephrocybe sp. NHM501043]